MFERHQGGERALLVHVTLTQFSEQASLTEFAELVRSAGATIIGQITGTRRLPDPKSFIGSGKVEEIARFVADEAIDLVLFNHTLSPAQERNLEREFKCRVLDRTGLILDIFAQRARSFEGKLQVELAQLKHLSTRLVRGWTHLERQKGGIGLRGPGETQLETDRRLLAERIKHIHRRLEKVTQQRSLSRQARQRAELPVVSLVGYTNAGKSTLFNRLTDAAVYAADQLFATLDTTVRRLELSNRGAVILADTVGFIQHLPHDLIAAFRATLDETRSATVLLHVVDASDPERQMRIEQVNQVLAEVGAAEVRQILVYNKIDQLPDEPARVEYDSEGQVQRIWLSAMAGNGLELLLNALEGVAHPDVVHQWVCVPAHNGQLRARLFQIGRVLQEQHAENGDCWLEVEMQTRQFNQLTHAEPNLHTANRPTGGLI